MSDSNLKWQCSHAWVPVFRDESCDVSEHLVCLQLSAPWGFDLISFAWHIHTPCAGICVKEAEPALLRGSSSPVQDIFGPVCGWELCGCQADRGCRGRVRIKEDVASSSKPHETVLSSLLIFHLSLKQKRVADIRSVHLQFSGCPTAWICVHMLMWPAFLSSSSSFFLDCVCFGVSVHEQDHP